MTMLADGRALVAGGLSFEAELFTTQVSGADAWRPTIAFPTPVSLAASIGVEGNLFRGISEASNGLGTQNSPTNYPLLVLRSIDHQHVRYLAPDPIAGWTDTTFTSVPLADFPTGAATLTVIANGIASVPVKLMVTASVGSKLPGKVAFPKSREHPT